MSELSNNQNVETSEDKVLAMLKRNADVAQKLYEDAKAIVEA